MGDPEPGALEARATPSSIDILPSCRFSKEQEEQICPTQALYQNRFGSISF